MKDPQFVLVARFDDGFHVGVGYRLGSDNYFHPDWGRLVTPHREKAAAAAQDLKKHTGLTRVVGARLLKEPP